MPYLGNFLIKLVDGLISPVAGMDPLLSLAALSRREFFDAKVLPRPDVIEDAEDGLDGERSQVFAGVGSGESGIVGGSARESQIAVGRSRVRRGRVSQSHVRQNRNDFVAGIGRGEKVERNVKSRTWISQSHVRQN